MTTGNWFCAKCSTWKSPQMAEPWMETNICICDVVYGELVLTCLLEPYNSLAITEFVPRIFQFSRVYWLASHWIIEQDLRFCFANVQLLLYQLEPLESGKDSIDVTLSESNSLKIRNWPNSWSAFSGVLRSVVKVLLLN